LAGSTVFTIITSLVAWWKHNYVTNKGKLQKEVLKQKGLTK
ncbi:phage holin, partial [Bacillus glycinifermentans]